MIRALRTLLICLAVLAATQSAGAGEVEILTAGSAVMPGPQTSAPAPRGPLMQAAPRSSHVLERVHRPGPITTKSLPNSATVALPAQSRATNSDPPGIFGVPQAAATFTLFQGTNLRDVLPLNNTSYVDEPCVAQSGSDVFLTGNWYAALSSNGGQTFQYVDPFTSFPSVNSGFCCDQQVTYDPGHDLFVWTLMYVEDGNSNTLRVAVGRGNASIEAGRWYYYDFNPQQLGIPSGYWFDYPRVALGTNYLYVSANVFATNDGPFADSVMLRIPLDALAAGGGFTFNYFLAADHFSFTPVSGANTTMYWASQDPFSYRIRVYRWAEGAGSIFWDDVDVNSYAATGSYCPGPDGRSWCGRSDDRIITGWVAGGVLGFMWNAAQDASHPYPYVRVVRLSEGTRAIIDQPDVHNPGFAFLYPAVGVNARGHIAGTIFYGGGAYYPTLASFVLDDLSMDPYVGGWELYTLASSNSGPEQDKWGDFLCAAPHRSDNFTWVAVGYVLRDGDAIPNVNPLFAWFGRERDAPITCRDGDPCDDGNACTTQDRCTGGSCAGSPVVCTPSDACHVPGTCQPPTGTCTNPIAPDGTACDDGNRCTTGDKCETGTCMGGTAVACSPLDLCHLAGVCQPATGTCTNPPGNNGAPCSDGNVCTQADYCQDGACVGSQPITIDGVVEALSRTPDLKGCSSRPDSKLLRIVSDSIRHARLKALAARNNPAKAHKLTQAARRALAPARMALNKSRKASAGCVAALGGLVGDVLQRLACVL